MKIGTKLLKWWLIVCLVLIGFGTSYHFDLHTLLYHADVTKLSFLIIIIFIFTSVWIGRKTYDLEANSVIDDKIDVGWFVAETCLALGMVGTVTGFLYMLGSALKILIFPILKHYKTPLHQWRRGCLLHYIQP